ncbi:MAG: hypothetical protein ACRD1Z_16530 [Vicinamibacteria bacterium]
MARRVAATIGHTAPIRCLELSPDPDLCLLKALETVDLFLPDVVFALAMRPAGTVSERVAVQASAANLDDGFLIDPTGPAMIDCTVPVVRIVREIRGGGIESEACEPVGFPAANRLAYVLLRYVSLRGEETWFHRKPPAGLASRIGVILLPGDRVETAVLAVSLAVEAVESWLGTENR